MSQLAILLGRQPLVLPPGIVTVHLSDTEPAPKPAPAPTKNPVNSWDHMLAKQEINIAKVLSAIEQGHVTQRAIATSAGIAKSTACILLKGLEENGEIVCIDGYPKKYAIANGDQSNEN